MEISEIINNISDSLSLSQEELAREFNMVSNLINGWEKKLNLISLKTLFHRNLKEI